MYTHNTNDCGCSDQAPCSPICNTCPVLISSDCVNNFTEDLTYSGIIKGQTLTEVFVQFDQYINSRFDTLVNYNSLINVGEGSQIYKGISSIGKKQIRSLLGSSLITVGQGADDITVSVKEDILNTFIVDRVNTYSATNIGTLGEGLFKDVTTTGLDKKFNFKKLKSTDNSVEIVGDAEYIDLSVNVSSVSGFVPYTGATSDVNLGEFGMQIGNLEFDNSPTGIPTSPGSLAWNDSDGTLDLKLKGGNVTLQVGQEIVVRVVNKTGVNILGASYNAVYISGAQGQRLKVNLAEANAESTSSRTIGLVTEDILNNLEGFVTTSGLVRGINTTGSIQGETWVDGDIIYLSPTVPGGLTKVEPIAPNNRVVVGILVSAHATQGSIFVKVDAGYSFEELHNVRFTGLLNNDILYYDSATTLWKNKQISTLVDGSETKLSASTNITITGTGTTLNPYVISSSAGGSAPDGSETKISAGTNISITGNGTIATPYIINATDTNTTYSAGAGLALSGTVFSIDNLQKVITYPTDFTGTNYTLVNGDNNYELIVDNGTTAVTITVPSGLESKFGVGFTQEGTADVTYVQSGTTINNPTGLKIKGQYYQTYLSQKGVTNTYFLGGNTKI